ncbi:hypothetical protein TWF730_008855 [Orbilia blumenaviensis]|uniref:Uncharacterized protein n=1 Tax=Orbilia blumenaviensis TaxID=1796055 RepID=A0AAV9V3W9_9PEZI
MEGYSKYWFANRETSVSGDEDAVLEEVSSRKRRSHNQFRFPETSHIPSPPSASTKSPKAAVKRSTCTVNTRSRKTTKTSRSSRVEEEEAVYHESSTMAPSSQPLKSCLRSSTKPSKALRADHCRVTGQTPDLDQSGALDISCCPEVDREFWAGFEKGLRDAYYERRCCGRSRTDRKSCAQCASARNA